MPEEPIRLRWAEEPPREPSPALARRLLDLLLRHRAPELAATESLQDLLHVLEGAE